MDQATFQQSVREDLARDLQLGRINEEIARAEAEIAIEHAKERAAPTVCATKLRLAHGNLHFWMAKKIIAERGLSL